MLIPQSNKRTEVKKNTQIKESGSNINEFKLFNTTGIVNKQTKQCIAVYVGQLVNWPYQ